MDFSGTLLQKSIEEEKNGKVFTYSPEDRAVLDQILKEINDLRGTSFQYLAELDHFIIPGSGSIVAKYIHQIESESVRAYLVHQVVNDRIKDCDKLIWDLYTHFVNSECCPFNPENEKSSYFVYVVYDNAFRILKPKRLKKELLSIAYRPQDAHNMGCTMRLLSSWKIPEMRDILLSYTDSSNLSAEMFGLSEDTEARKKRVEFGRQQLLFSAINGLKYYPSPEVEALIRSFAESQDKDIRLAANKTLKVFEKKKNT